MDGADLTREELVRYDDCGAIGAEEVPMYSMSPTIGSYPVEAIRRYALVATVIAVAAAFEFFLEEFVGSRQPLLLMWPCVVLAAWVGGFRLGAFATLVSIPALAYFVIEPAFDLRVENELEWIWLGLFVVLGLSVSDMVSRFRPTAKLPNSRELDPEASDLAQTVDLRPLASRQGRSLFPERGEEPIPGYHLVCRVGRGGAGEVWQATNPDGASVALKFVPWMQKSAEAEVKMVDAMKTIRHPHLLSVFELVRTREYLIIVMELANRTLLDRWWEGMPFEELLDDFRQAAEGIDYLHELKIQHRDIKPQNLLLVGAELKVADFGLARIVSHSITQHTGQMTVAYAAPEYFDGHTSKHSDQYSLAISYCQLRGGRLPFVGSAAQIVAGHINLAPDLTMLPESERPVVDRALSKRPNERWPTCRDFIDALGNG
jgi:hypothetical protein